jgi:hypothetical protein
VGGARPVLRGGWEQSTRTRYCDTTRGNGWQQGRQTSSYIAEPQPYSPRAADAVQRDGKALLAAGVLGDPQPVANAIPLTCFSNDARCFPEKCSSMPSFP